MSLQQIKARFAAGAATKLKRCFYFLKGVAKIKRILPERRAI